MLLCYQGMDCLIKGDSQVADQAAHERKKNPSFVAMYEIAV
jgi:hypothetical protein